MYIYIYTSIEMRTPAIAVTATLLLCCYALGYTSWLRQSVHAIIIFTPRPFPVSKILLPIEC